MGVTGRAGLRVTRRIRVAMRTGMRGGGGGGVGVAGGVAAVGAGVGGGHGRGGTAGGPWMCCTRGECVCVCVCEFDASGPSTHASAYINNSHQSLPFLPVSPPLICPTPLPSPPLHAVRSCTASATACCTPRPCHLWKQPWGDSKRRRGEKRGRGRRGRGGRGKQSPRWGGRRWGGD